MSKHKEDAPAAQATVTSPELAPPTAEVDVEGFVELELDQFSDTPTGEVSPPVPHGGDNEPGASTRGTAPNVKQARGQPQFDHDVKTPPKPKSAAVLTVNEDAERLETVVPSFTGKRMIGKDRWFNFVAGKQCRVPRYVAIHLAETPGALLM